MVAKAADFQNNNYNFIVNSKQQLPDPRGTQITDKNLVEIAIYYNARHCIKTTWLNDRDLFHYPENGWQTDVEFQTDCLAFTLFSNKIQSQYGVNHWIPFTEQEVKAHALFESHFTPREEGKQTLQRTGTLRDLAQEQSFIPTEPLVFSPEATAVFDAGRELWRYYHAQPNANPNASYYDIREYFQGRNDKGKMNPKSDDAEYMRLLGNLKEAMEALRLKIVPKVYEYGFLLS